MVAGQLICALVAALGATATPIGRLNLVNATIVSQDVIDSWTQPAHFAGAAYCDSDQIEEWDCGGPCDEITTAPKVLATGGDNKATPLWFVAKNGTHIIVSIAGTNPGSLRSIQNDLDFTLTDIDTTLFPDAPTVRLHHGFHSAFKRMASGIHAAVQTEVAAGTKDVLVVGHSQGGALGHLAAVHLQRTIPEVSVVGRMFAAPRVGNQEWANYLDATLGEYSQHMSHLNDIVPQLPPAEWGFVHSSNEVWIKEDKPATYISCSNGESEECQVGLGLVGYVSEFATSLDALVHLGPYAGVRLGRQKCKHLGLF